MSVGGVTYELAQRVIDRRESTYENILTINDTLANLVDDNFTCTVANTLGMTTSPSITIRGEIYTILHDGNRSVLPYNYIILLQY